MKKMKNKIPVRVLIGDRKKTNGRNIDREKNKIFEYKL